MSSHRPQLVNTFGQGLQRRHGRRALKVAIHAAGFTCPNREGSKGRGGCTLRNHVSFSPQVRREPAIDEQIAAGRTVLDLLARYRDEVHEMWLEIGLPSAFDDTLDRVNRCHSFAEYVAAVRAARVLEHGSASSSQRLAGGL